MSAQADGIQLSSKTVSVPALLTNSLRTIFGEFQGNIIQVSAHGSVTTPPTQVVVDGFEGYDFVRKQETQHSLELNYRKEKDIDPANPLDKTTREDLLEEVSTTLTNDSLSVEPDLAVTELVIRVRSDKLAEVTGAQTTEFDLRFGADPAEEAIKGQTRLVNRGKGLYEELGFNITNLNLRSVEETKTKFDQQGDGQFFYWRGPRGDVPPRITKQLAIRINRDILPDDVGTLKHYGVVDEQTLELKDNSDTVDEEDENEDEETVERGEK
jgi:hypothetical protein